MNNKRLQTQITTKQTGTLWLKVKYKLLLACLFLWGLLDYHTLKCTGSLTSWLTRRALQIRHYFLLADTSKAAAPGTVGHDKMFRIRKFLTIISRNVEWEYRLSRDISINETMAPHKDRLSFKQYIKNKPTWWGIKLWVLCKAETGYVYTCKVF